MRDSSVTGVETCALPICTSTLGGTINNAAGGTFKIDNGAVLNLEAGTYSQLGTLQMNSAGFTTELVLQGNLTLGGGDTVTLSKSTSNFILSAQTTPLNSHHTRI